MTKIAIVGATDPTGIHLVAELRKTAAAVRVIARGGNKLAQLFPEAVIEKRSADILDANATLHAIDGCGLVYDCIGLPGTRCICIRWSRETLLVRSGKPKRGVSKCRATGPITRKCRRK